MFAGLRELGGGRAVVFHLEVRAPPKATVFPNPAIFRRLLLPPVEQRVADCDRSVHHCWVRGVLVLHSQRSKGEAGHGAPVTPELLQA